MQELFKKDGTIVDLLEKNDLDWEKLTFTKNSNIQVYSYECKINRKLKLIKMRMDFTALNDIVNGTSIGTLSEYIPFMTNNGGCRYKDGTVLYSVGYNAYGINFYVGTISKGERILLQFMDYYG